MPPSTALAPAAITHFGAGIVPFHPWQVERNEPGAELERLFKLRPQPQITVKSLAVSAGDSLSVANCTAAPAPLPSASK